MSQAIRLLAGVLVLAAAVGCARREPFTSDQASQLVMGVLPPHEPVYAEVPQRVWWSNAAPRDDYDGLALATLKNLERAGLITVAETHDGDTVSYVGRVTQKGFTVLGTAPSARGPCFRGQICEKEYEGLRNFKRHPNDPTVAFAELAWHYAKPTPLYPMFETKIDKRLNVPMLSFVSFFYKDYAWGFDIPVKKAHGP